ncbi:MAG: RNA 3'-terminal phosphate cyclase [Candidatus Pacearchaeota archaeon]
MEKSKKEVVEIDGSYGSGSGQIIRTALALSALTNKAFHIVNIRAKRKNPGLAAQHFSCVDAVAKLCNAKVQGNFIGSKELWFWPGNEIKTTKLKIDIGTAGSIALVLQALMPVVTKINNAIEIEIRGGTDVKGAPSIDYINNILLTLLRKFNYRATLKIVRRGFFPKGGGIINFKAEPMELKQFNLIESGQFLRIKGISIASMNLKKANVANRQAQQAEKLLNGLNLPIDIQTKYEESYSPGSAITIWLETRNSVIGSSVIGERRKSSEKVGTEVAVQLLKEIEQKAAVDIYASDQLLPYLALTKSSLKTSGISEHAKTNAFVIEKFLPVKFKIDKIENIISIKKY